MLLETYLCALGGYTFSKEVQTAGASKSNILVNPDFWELLNETERSFLIDHEVLHVVLNHHSRFEKEHHGIANVACDLAINSMLYEQYVGKKDPARIIPKLWEAGQFPQKYGMETLRGADFYLELLKQSMHMLPQALRGAIQRASSEQSGSKELEEKLEESGGFSLDGTEIANQVKIELMRSKQSFESLLKELYGNTSLHSGFVREERFCRARRGPTSSLALPEMWSESGQAKIRKNKIGLFLDFSGSCSSMTGIFQAAAELIPKQFFVVDKYKFATKLAKFEENTFIGGGTNFGPIQGYEKMYDQIWIFSDADGNMPCWSTPSKITWFLGGDCIRPENIHKPASMYILSNFVRKK